ncbi:hypothetical protein POX_c03996 [Penicillium oxalicum]|uniref:hypothetical protein n=1 Tax=Penicillium oxalicum TaxID=69781 RepID=UPI0020B89A22|nr:hypothetical protein POX_c03996 [Penicillium oxalicum]KAI2791140.1 hypothetical protein POX_c03996 [Penicillium oxalicum]
MYMLYVPHALFYLKQGNPPIHAHQMGFCDLLVGPFCLRRTSPFEPVMPRRFNTSSDPRSARRFSPFGIRAPSSSGERGRVHVSKSADVMGIPLPEASGLQPQPLARADWLSWATKLVTPIISSKYEALIVSGLRGYGPQGLYSSVHLSTLLCRSGLPPLNIWTNWCITLESLMPKDSTPMTNPSPVVCADFETPTFLFEHTISLATPRLNSVVLDNAARRHCNFISGPAAI